MIKQFARWLLLLTLAACSAGHATTADAPPMRMAMRGHVPIRIGGGLSSGGSPQSGVYYPGSALGGFTSGNTVTSTSANIVFHPGMTLWWTFQTNGVGTVGTENILGCFTGGLTKGWALTRQATTGNFYLLGSATSFTSLTAPPVGISATALVWSTSGNAVHYSINGGPFTAVNAVTLSAAPDGTSTSTLGSPVSGFGGIALASGRVLNAATWASEATAAQAVAYTYPSGNRAQLPAAVLASAVFNFQASRDWNGSASTITTQGSTPVTFAVGGSPSLVKTDEVRYAASSTYYRDGKIAIPAVDANGVAYTTRDPYAHVEFKTSAVTIAAEVYSTLYSAFAPQSVVGTYVNGVWSSQYSAVSVGTPQIANVQLAAGASKTVDVWEGPSTMSGTTDVFPYTRLGTFLLGWRLPVYLYDGATLTNSAMVAMPPPPMHRLVLLGDSILTAWYTSVPTDTSITALLRGDFPTSGTGGVTAHEAGSDSIGDVASTPALVNATAASIVAELDGTVSNVLWIELGTNDYGASAISVSNFQAYYAALLDAIHALSPGTVIYCQSPIQRIAPDGEADRGYGTLGAYRTAISTVVSTRTGFATYVEGGAGAIVTNGQMYTDGIHLIDSGAAAFKAFVKTKLAY